jgi:hypothetical protein
MGIKIALFNGLQTLEAVGYSIKNSLSMKLHMNSNE